jgi:hypothetical protein
MQSNVNTYPASPVDLINIRGHSTDNGVSQSSSEYVQKLEEYLSITEALLGDGKNGLKPFIQMQVVKKIFF